MVELEQGASLVNKIRLKTDSLAHLRVLVFRGKSSEEFYPYKTTKDFIGILFDRDDFCSPALNFTMF